MGAEILRGRFVRIGLALVVEHLGLPVVHPFGCVADRCVNLLDVRANFVVFRVSVLAYGRSRFLRASKRFARENYRLAAFGGRRSVFVGAPMIPVAMSMIVVTMVVTFKILKNVADVKESVAVQPDIHESGLHTRQNACDFSFVDAADEGEFFFALDVDFD